MSDRREPKPADYRRPAPEDGALRRLYWYGWVMWEYAKMLSVGVIALFAAIMVGGAGARVLVPTYIARPEFGWIFITWVLAVVGVFVLWGRGRMARTGIESR